MNAKLKGIERVKRIRELCIEKDWFTCVSTRQYEKMFDMVREGVVFMISLLLFGYAVMKYLM